MTIEFSNITAEDTLKNPKVVFDAISREIVRRQSDVVQNGGGERHKSFESLQDAISNLPKIGFRQKSKENALAVADALAKNG